jgi:hypothetical protein
VALAVGWAGSRFVLPSPARAISSAEYVAVVAQLYQQDHNVDLARQRLAVVGSPGDLIKQAEQASAAGRLSTPSDSAAVDALAAAFTSDATGADPVSATPTTSADSLSSGVAADQSSTGGSGRSSWLGPVIAFVMAFGLGVVVLLRTAGLSLSFIKLPLPTLQPNSERRSTTRATDSRAWDPSGRRHTSLSIAEVRIRDEDDEGQLDTATDVAADRPVATVTRSRPAAATRVRRAPVFQSSYTIGDDPFDEIHPISDPTSGSLIAACGLSAALKVESVDVGGYFAFTAWVQDYVNGEDLHAAGLIAPGAPDSARGQIEGWVRGGQIDTVLPLERGASAQVGTADLAATVTVVAVAFGHDRSSRDSFVSELTVRFDIELGESLPTAK